MDDFMLLKVGEPLPPQLRGNLIEGAVLVQDRDGGLMLLLGLPGPSEEEVAAVKSGRLDMSYVTDDTESFWMGLLSVRDVLDFDFTFDITRYPLEEREARLLALTRSNLLHVVLVNTITDIIKAQRVGNVSMKFMRSMYSASSAALGIPDYGERYSSWIDEMYRLPVKELCRAGTPAGYLGMM